MHYLTVPIDDATADAITSTLAATARDAYREAEILPEDAKAIRARAARAELIASTLKGGDALISATAIPYREPEGPVDVLVDETFSLISALGGDDPLPIAQRIQTIYELLRMIEIRRVPDELRSSVCPDYWQRDGKAVWPTK